MATLEKIRSRSKLLFFTIAFALFAFILGDFFNAQSTFTGSQTEIGEVAGNSLQYQEYLTKEKELNEVYSRTNGQVNEFLAEQIRTQAWEELIQAALMGEQYATLGLGVSEEELYDMVQGTELDPVVSQIFTNPQTGEINKAQILQFLKAVNDGTMDEANKAYWLFLEKDIKKRREFQKYLNLVSKGLNVTSLEAKADFEERQYMVDFNFVVKPFSAISDTEVELTEAEIADYYQKNKDKFEQLPSRDIEYVTFEINPSEQDIAETKEYIAGLKENFASTEDVARFVSLNSDQPYQDRFYKKGELDPLLDSVIRTAPVGYIHGPYEDGGAYKLAKVVERKAMPDSVQASHILIRVDATTSLDIAKARVDSLKAAVLAGSSFEALALQFGTDGTKEKGGDLGWFPQNAMVKPFNDAVFNGKKGDLLSIETQFGVHLVKIVDQGAASEMAKVAFVSRSLEASPKTFQDVYAAANKFAADCTSPEAFEKALTDLGMNKKMAPGLTATETRIPGLDAPRELIRWAYKEETVPGSFSPVFELGNKFVVATLRTIREEGPAPLANIKGEIETILKKEKKAEKILAEMQGISSLSDAASKLGVQVQQASNITFASRQIPGAGVEPAVIGAAVKLEKEKISKPIKGATGIFVLQVSSVTNPTFENPSYEPNRQSLVRSLQNRANYDAYNALKKKAEIVDNRAKFM